MLKLASPLFVALAMGMALAVAACGSDAPSPSQATPQEGSQEGGRQAELLSLHEIDELEALFDADDGSVRLVMLLSPT